MTFNPVIIKRQASSVFPSFTQIGSCNLIGAIKVPTLVIVGTEDASIPVSVTFETAGAAKDNGMMVFWFN